MKEIIRAAYVIARRDFTAIIRSKAFFFFLLGPLFPVVIGVVAGNLGNDVAGEIDRPAIGVALSAGETQRLVAARDALAEQLGANRLPELHALPADAAVNPRDALKDRGGALAAVLSGTLDAPVLTGTSGQTKSWKGSVELMIAHAVLDSGNGGIIKMPDIRLEAVRSSAGADRRARLLTAQGGQALLFLLTMLLAGMVLSNVVEEKSNKIIEVLAAAIPIDAIFLGKLFAMLAMAGVGIVIWGTLGVGTAALFGADLPSLPAPAVGWPMFALLGTLYFAMAYLLLGAMFLGIGAQAATVREVQTLSMPVTMAQLVIFFYAMHSVTRIGSTSEVIACIFPFTSPFAMLARAAQEPVLWTHLVALIGQGLFVALILRIGVHMFRRNVMKSGSARRGILAAFR